MDDLEKLRYPVGRLDSVQPPADAGERSELIDRIANAPAVFRSLVGTLADAALDTPYRPGGWTVRQVVHHVADSHMNAFIRFRLGLTEDNPTIKPYDEKAWCELPDTKHLPVEISLNLLDALHERMVHLLRSVPPANFQRSIYHPENGPMTLDAVVSLYAWHGQHHTAHVTALRKREGWS